MLPNANQSIFWPFVMIILKMEMKPSHTTMWGIQEVTRDHKQPVNPVTHGLCSVLIVTYQACTENKTGRQLHS